MATETKLMDIWDKVKEMEWDQLKRVAVLGYVKITVEPMLEAPEMGRFTRHLRNDGFVDFADVLEQAMQEEGQ